MLRASSVYRCIYYVLVRAMGVYQQCRSNLAVEEAHATVPSLNAFKLTTWNHSCQ